MSNNRKTSTEIEGINEANPLLTSQLALIDSILNSLKNHYYDPKRFKEDKVANELKQRLVEKLKDINSSAILEKLNSADFQKVFVDELNKTLAEYDSHIILKYSPEDCNWLKDQIDSDGINKESGSVTFNSNRDPEIQDDDALKSMYAGCKELNYGFIEKPKDVVIKIPDNVGYVKITNFFGPRWGENASENKIGPETIATANNILNGFVGKKAIIFDLRDNHGGSSEMVQYILSSLLKTGVPINTMYDSLTNSTKVYNAVDTGIDLSATKKVYVLINKNTFSAGEEFAYDLQQINNSLKDNRFTIVGQSSSGAAHPTVGLPLVEDASTGKINDKYCIYVPYGSSINPYTSTNWEDGPKKEGGKPGVQPDFKISNNQDALQVTIDTIQRSREMELNSVASSSTNISSHGSTAFIAKGMNFTPSTQIAPNSNNLDLEKEKIYSVSLVETPKTSHEVQAVPNQSTSTYKTPTLTRKLPGTKN